MIEMFVAPLVFINFHLLFGLILLAGAVVAFVFRLVRWLVTPPNWRGVDDDDSIAENFFDGLWSGRRGGCRWW